jgi:catechol 2,3-dioxygenase-like lactoylglutathione lyase family enzyme
MSLTAKVAFLWCAAAAGALPQTRSVHAQDRSGLIRLVTAVQDADYRGDLRRLRSIAGQMEPYTAYPSLAASARYWRGFAHWRHALNSLNDGAPPDSADQDFAAAIAEFRAALALDSSDVEAAIGLAAGLSNRGYFNQRAPERASAFRNELGPLLQRIREAAPDNPRMMFVTSAGLFWAPKDRGGSREQAIAMLERGIRLAAAPSPVTDTLEPTWGEAELHMLLGWFSLNLDPPQAVTALRHADAALELRPHWRYVRDNLLPQIRRRVAGRARLTTLAYRVHDMPGMVAFYREAFGFEFREVNLVGGLRAQFGRLDSLTLKFVPIRDAANFEEFPIHQPGFEVDDVEAVLAIAVKHGGRVQDPAARENGRLQAAVRDPDGNTLELYAFLTPP